ncbi:MAG: cardiolipin synthase [Rikenellaceae bacterium]
MDHFATYMIILALIIYSLFIMSALYTIVYEKGDPVKAISWIVVVILLPFLGFICYIIFGRNYRKQKIFNHKAKSDLKYFNYIIKRQLYKVNSNFFDKREEVDTNKDIITLLLNNSNSPLSYKNNVTILNNGENAFPEIIESLKEAQEHIHLEYYMFLDDEIGSEIIDILCKKSQNGVSVRLIYDDIGSWGFSHKAIKELRNAGVEVVSFMPVLFPLLTSKINYRNHRKIIVIDGKVGFTGGMNIADKYIKGNKELGKWHDIHLKIEGRAVLSLQLIFTKDWFFLTGEEIKNVNLFPGSNLKDGDTTMQVVTSGPDSHWASIMQAFFKAITQAKEQINVSTPYFSPSESILTALKVAALGGVEVNVMIPSKNDSTIVYWATRSYIAELLEAGVNVYIFLDGFNHSKLITIDSEFSAIGSANIDIRSFEYNFEITAFMFDKEKTSELKNIYYEDIKQSRKLEFESWANRPRKEKTLEAFCRITSPLL